MKRILGYIAQIVVVVIMCAWLTFIALLPFAGIYWLLNIVLLK